MDNQILRYIHNDRHVAGLHPFMLRKVDKILHHFQVNSNLPTDNVALLFETSLGHIVKIKWREIANRKRAVRIDSTVLKSVTYATDECRWIEIDNTELTLAI